MVWPISLKEVIFILYIQITACDECSVEAIHYDYVLSIMYRTWPDHAVWLPDPADNIFLTLMHKQNILLKKIRLNS